MDSARALHLSFGDRIHEFDSPLRRIQAQQKRLGPQHGSLDRPTVLLDEVIEIFRLADLDGRFAIAIDRFECGKIGAAFVDSHCLGHAILGD